MAQLLDFRNEFAYNTKVLKICKDDDEDSNFCFKIPASRVGVSRYE